MNASGFRSAYAASLWPDKAADVLFHAAAMGLLPGPWWAQLLPDAAVLLVWLPSMLSDRALPQDSRLLAAHRALHLRGRYALPAAAAVLLGGAWLAPLVSVQYLAHVAIDSATHGREWL